MSFLIKTVTKIALFWQCFFHIWTLQASLMIIIFEEKIKTIKENFNWFSAVIPKKATIQIFWEVAVLKNPRKISASLRRSSHQRCSIKKWCFEACNFIKKDSGTGVFLWICEISKKIFFFYRTHLEDCFCWKKTCWYKRNICVC